MADEKSSEGIESREWYQKLSAVEKELVQQLIQAQKGQGDM